MPMRILGVFFLRNSYQCIKTTDSDKNKALGEKSRVLQKKLIRCLKLLKERSRNCPQINQNEFYCNFVFADSESAVDLVKLRCTGRKKILRGDLLGSLNCFFPRLHLKSLEKNGKIPVLDPTFSNYSYLPNDIQETFWLARKHQQVMSQKASNSAKTDFDTEKEALKRQFEAFLDECCSKSFYVAATKDETSLKNLGRNLTIDKCQQCDCDVEAIDDPIPHPRYSLTSLSQDGGSLRLNQRSNDLLKRNKSDESANREYQSIMTQANNSVTETISLIRLSHDVAIKEVLGDTYVDLKNKLSNKFDLVKFESLQCLEELALKLHNYLTLWCNRVAKADLIKGTYSAVLKESLKPKGFHCDKVFNLQKIMNVRQARNDITSAGAMQNIREERYTSQLIEFEQDLIRNINNIIGDEQVAYPVFELTQNCYDDNKQFINQEANKIPKLLENHNILKIKVADINNLVLNTVPANAITDNLANIFNRICAFRQAGNPYLQLPYLSTLFTGRNQPLTAYNINNNNANVNNNSPPLFANNTQCYDLVNKNNAVKPIISASELERLALEQYQRSEDNIFEDLEKEAEDQYHR